MLLAALLVAPTLAAGQHNGKSAPPAGNTSAAGVPREAAQFDFLIGQWEVEVRPKVPGLAARIHGAPKLLGTWKAWKVLDGYAVEDELRIVDGSGNPASLTLAVRLWSASEQKWSTTSIDAYRGRVSTGSATMTGNNMELTGQGFDPNGRPVRTRSRFSKVTARGFTLTQDRSGDEGKTWDNAVLVMEARRTAATAPR
jgi:hypothetical protein